MNKKKVISIIIVALVGTLIFWKRNYLMEKLGLKYASKIKTVPYKTPTYDVIQGGTCLFYKDEIYQLKIFGGHNLQNLIH